MSFYIPCLNNIEYLISKLVAYFTNYHSPYKLYSDFSRHAKKASSTKFLKTNVKKMRDQDFILSVFSLRQTKFGNIREERHI